MAFNNSRDIRIARDANNVVHGDQHNHAHSSDEELLHLLAQNAAPNGCHDSEQRFPPPNCHEGTRLQILEMLSNRIEDKSMANSVLWLYGSAGVGKSAIAQHLAEKYARSGRLGAAFFFSRNDSTRDKIRPLVPSIAYQFCKSESPLCTTLAPAIFDAIRSDPNIFHSSCENQVQKLILKACSNIDTVEQENPPNVIIIDGLDECVNRAEQGRVLDIVRALISCSSSYFSWIILLCSRPEPQIRRGFSHEGFVRHPEAFDINSLDDVNWDIYRYLADNFATLRTKHRHALGQDGSSWPGEDVIGKLVVRADGQFIFVSTIIQYIDVDDEPLQARLDTIMRIYVEQEESPYSNLDILYRQILSTCRDWGKVRELLRLLVTPHHDPPSGTFLGREVDPLYNHPDYRREDFREAPMLLKWRSFERFSDFLNIPVCEVSTLLIRLHSILQIPDNTNLEQDVQFSHATFTEFLADSKRSGEFYTPAMSEPEYCDCVATLLLRTLAAFTPSYPLYRLESFERAKRSWFQKLKSAHWLVAFSCGSWDYYCSKVISPSVDLLGELENMDVHVVVAISLVLDTGLPLNWGIIHCDWAKTLRNSRMDMLMETLEITLMEVHIALEPSSKYTPRRRMFEGIFHIEQWLLGPETDGFPFDKDMMSRESTTSSSSAPSLKFSFEALLARTNRSTPRNILVVPRNILLKVSNTVPVVCVTRDNAYVFQRIYGDPMYMPDNLLLGYVMDRKLTISGNPVMLPEDVKEEDLARFATVFKEWLAVLSLGLQRSEEGDYWLVDTAGQDFTRATLRGTSPLSSPNPNTTPHPSAGPPSSPGLNSSQTTPLPTGTRRTRSQSPECRKRQQTL